MITIKKGAGQNTVSFPMIENGQIVQNTKTIDELSIGERRFIVNSVTRSAPETPHSVSDNGKH